MCVCGGYELSEIPNATAKPAFPVAIEKYLLVAVPTVAVVGGAFWFGYLNVAGRDYLWLLTVQDLLMVSLLLVPLYGVTLLAMYGLGAFREPVVPSERGPIPALVDLARLGGSDWNPRAERWIRISAIIVGGITIIAMGSLILNPRGWAANWMFLLMTISAGFAQMYATYRRERYGDGYLFIIAVLSVLFLVVTTSIGSSNALSAEDRAAKSFRIEFEGGKQLSVSGLQKLGDHFLFYEHGTKAWWVRRVDDVVSLTQETKVEAKTEAAAPAPAPAPAPETAAQP